RNMADKRISELDPAGPLTGNELIELAQQVGSELESVQAPLQSVAQQLALQGPEGTPGAEGDDGWSPILAAMRDGARRVLQVSGWAGGSGTAPASGQFVGDAGLVGNISNAADIRGAQGPQGDLGLPGDQGPQGNPGTPGSDGDDGWSPIFAIVSD